MTTISSETLHASCVSIDGRAVLIEGRPGSGKSDLTLRLIDRGAQLVSDDYTILIRSGDQLLATAPATIAGRIEVRGLGIIDMPYVERVPVVMLIAVTDDPHRLPLEPEFRLIAGVTLPAVPLAALESSAPIKVELALKRLHG